MSESESALPEGLAQRAERYRDALEPQKLPMEPASMILEGDADIDVGPDHTLSNHKDAIGVKVEGPSEVQSAVKSKLEEITNGTQYKFVRMSRTDYVVYHEAAN